MWHRRLWLTLLRPMIQKNEAVIAAVPVFRLGSSLRTRPPQQTFDLARQVMPRLGISRVTQITRMDRLGLPVFASIRPRGLALRVHAGKGMTEIDAQIGALMEAIEFAVAEPAATSWQMESPTVLELAKQLPPEIRFVDFVPKYGLQVAANDVVPSVACVDIASGKSALIPAQLVFMPYFPEHAPNLFGGTTNGLASGNTIDEATLHGLLEVLERDTIAMNSATNGSRWIDPASFPEPFSSLSQAWAKIGVELTVRFLPNEFDLPCFQAILHEAESNTVNIAGGYGLHVNATIALSRAICEAAQSRLSHIHGGRDDITEFYKKYTDMAPAPRKTKDAELAAAFGNKLLAARFSDLPTDQTEHGIEQQLARLLTRLAAQGFKQVYRYVFDAQLPELAVVKVVVPKCEHMAHQGRRIGPRLMKSIVSNGRG